MEDIKKSLRITISIIFFISFLIFIVLNKIFDISGDINFYLILLMISIGIFSFSIELESKLFIYFNGHFSIKPILAASLAVCVFIGRSGGIADVNSVFGIDPSALPMATLAASAMYIFYKLMWAYIVVSIISFILLIRGVIKGSPNLAWLSTFITSLVLFFACQAFDDTGRKQRIYRIAHATDISSKFSCRDIDMEQNAVLFIGPEQKKVMVVPKIKEALTLGNQGKQASFFREIKIPDEFTITECIP